MNRLGEGSTPGPWYLEESVTVAEDGLDPDTRIRNISGQHWSAFAAVVSDDDPKLDPAGQKQIAANARLMAQAWRIPALIDVLTMFAESDILAEAASVHPWLRERHVRPVPYWLRSRGSYERQTNGVPALWGRHRELQPVSSGRVAGSGREWHL